LGGLTLSIDALRVVEEAAADENALQTNMQIVDECGNLGDFRNLLSTFAMKKKTLFAVNADECARAADIYQCGRDKAPAVTNAIQSKVLNSVPAVRIDVFVICGRSMFQKSKKIKH